jgi:hypothetical protein
MTKVTKVISKHYIMYSFLHYVPHGAWCSDKGNTIFQHQNVINQLVSLFCTQEGFSGNPLFLKEKHYYIMYSGYIVVFLKTISIGKFFCYVIT